MTTVLGLLGAVTTLASAAALVRMHLQPNGHDPLHDAVSDYGLGPTAGYYRWHTALSAYAALFVAAALARTEHPVPQLLVYLLLTFACARLVIPSYPTDPDRSRPTGTGRVHILLAAAAFASIAWCAAALPGRVDWPSLHGFLVVLGWIVVATAAACALGLAAMLVRVTVPFFGALQRAFYVAMLTWLFVVSVHFV